MTKAKAAATVVLREWPMPKRRAAVGAIIYHTTVVGTGKNRAYVTDEAPPKGAK